MKLILDFNILSALEPSRISSILNELSKSYKLELVSILNELTSIQSNYSRSNKSKSNTLISNLFAKFDELNLNLLDTVVLMENSRVGYLANFIIGYILGKINKDDFKLNVDMYTNKLELLNRYISLVDLDMKANILEMGKKFRHKELLLKYKCEFNINNITNEFINNFKLTKNEFIQVKIFREIDFIILGMLYSKFKGQLKFGFTSYVEDTMDLTLISTIVPKVDKQGNLFKITRTYYSEY
jgi:hypothetical protein